LRGLFGDDWERGIGPLHEQERRNYLFAVKSGSWLDVWRAYGDVGFSSVGVGPGMLGTPVGAGGYGGFGGGYAADETVPFLKPLRNPTEEEIRTAEAKWSEWLAMQDW
jgi:hypothetical protein